MNVVSSGFQLNSCCKKYIISRKIILRIKIKKKKNWEIYRKLLKPQDFLPGREVRESRMSLVQRRVHHMVEPCADPVRGSVEPCLMPSRWIRSEKRQPLTTRLSNILRNPHQFRRTHISRRNRGCSTGASRSFGKWRGRCLVRAAGRLGILNGDTPRATTTTTTLSRRRGLIIVIRPEYKKLINS